MTPVNQVLTPIGRQVDLPGMRPQGVALSPDGKLLVVSGKTSEYTLSSVVQANGGGLSEARLLLDPATASAVRGRPLMFQWLDLIVKLHATEILDVSSAKAVDGREYVQIKVAEPADISEVVGYKSVALVSPSQRVHQNRALQGSE